MRQNQLQRHTTRITQTPPVMAMYTQNNHLQPFSNAIYPLMTNAMGGPKVLLSPYIAIALPLLFLVHRSLTVPPVLVRGAAPPKPAMKRHTMTVPMLGASAIGSWKMNRMNQEPMYTGLRPKYSLRGASSIWKQRETQMSGHSNLKISVGSTHRPDCETEKIHG